MYCRLRSLKYQFLSHKKGFLCEMRQIHFDINFGNFCCRIKNSFEKSERDPHLGKQLSNSDINTDIIQLLPNFIQNEKHKLTENSIVLET